MYAYFAHWDWVTEGGMSFWDAPYAEKCIGRLDMRSLPQCGQHGGRPDGEGFFFYPTPSIDGMDALGSLEDHVNHSNRIALKKQLKNPDDIPDMNIRDILWWLLVTQGDPTGQERWKPLRGSPRTGIRLYLAKKLIRQEAFDHNHPAWPGTLAVFQEDYRRLREQCLGVASDHYLKFLDAKSKIYGVPSEVLLEGSGLPSEGIKPSETSVSDNFNRGDEELGVSSDWTEVAGDWEVQSNQVVALTQTNMVAKHNTALSSDGHYAQVVCDSESGPTNEAEMGVLIRKHATDATLTYYAAWLDYYADNWMVYKRVGGGFTLIDWDSYALTPGTPTTIYMENTEDDLMTVKVGGVTQYSGTQSDITGNLYVGMHGYKASAAKPLGDDFEAGDLGVVTRRIFVVA